MYGRRAVKAAAAVIACVAITGVADAARSPARLRAHSVYGGVTSRKDAFVALRTASATTIAASPANTAPELLHSNVNLECANKAQVNTGMVQIKLKLQHGSYSFSRRFSRIGVKETSPGSGSVTLRIAISGKVRNSETITGTVKVTGPRGCSIPLQAYTAKLHR